jgi:hypothetical protein
MGGPPSCWTSCWRSFCALFVVKAPAAPAKAVAAPPPPPRAPPEPCFCGRPDCIKDRVHADAVVVRTKKKRAPALKSAAPPAAPAAPAASSFPALPLPAPWRHAGSPPRFQVPAGKGGGGKGGGKGRGGASGGGGGGGDGGTNGSGAGARKKRFRLALLGDPEGVEAALGRLVRDANIKSRHDELLALADAGAPFRAFYNLRPRAGGREVVTIVAEHVDHQLECQMLAHVLCFDPAAHAVWGGGGAASLLGAIDVRAAAPSKLNEQPAVVGAALAPIFRIQNCNGDEPFNLRLMGGSVNQTKGHAVKGWLKARAQRLVAAAARGGGSGDGSSGLAPTLEAFFLKSKAAKRGEVGPGDAGAMASACLRELHRVRDAYVARLEAAAEMADFGAGRSRSVGAERLRALAAGVDALLGDAAGE